jgi:hypothetical protein
MRIVRACLLSALLLSIASVAAAQVTDPPVIVDAFERARTQGRLDDALSYFADDATVVLMDRGASPVVGKNSIRGFLQVTRGTPPLIMSDRHVVGNTVTWTERHPGQRPVDLSVQALVEDGKIRSLTYRLAAPAAVAVPETDAAARISAPLAMSGVALLAVSLLVAASLTPRRQPSASALRGKLMASLSEFGARARVG